MADDLGNKLGQDIPLFELIQTLRQELKAATEAARKDAFKLDLEEVEVSLQLVVTREAKANAKITFWVVAEGGAEAKRGSTQTHSIKLKLKPAGPNRILVTDESHDADE